MSRHDSERALARRSFLSKFGLGLVTGGAAAGVATPGLQAQSAGGFQPSKHDLDAWYDQVPGTHRFVVDSFSPEGFGNAIAFLNNYYTANGTGYGLKDSDLAVVLIARHTATPFTYGESIWNKYGVPITGRTLFNDPKTKQPPTTNIYNSTAYGAALNSRGNTLESLVKRGVRLAVCQMSTRAYSQAIGMATNQTPEAVYAEIMGSLPMNARLVPAGIVAVNRAQERGFTVAVMS